MRIRALISAACLLFCAPALAQEATKLPVVATFSILGDMTRAIGGERIALTTLVGPMGDAHVYSPTPQDAKAMAAARLVVRNGLGFEGWMDRLVRASGSKGLVVVASKGVVPLKAQREEGGHHHGHGHDHKMLDPHAWQSLVNARLYVGNIRDGLIAADPAGKADYETRAAAYLAQIDALEAEIRALVEKIPAGERRAITTHDAFGYFTQAYGIAFLSAQGVSTDAEPDARGLARLLRQIRATGVKAVFIENVAGERLAQRIASEAGVKTGERLYADALSDANGPAPTYLAMMKHNIHALTSALTH